MNLPAVSNVRNSPLLLAELNPADIKLVSNPVLSASKLVQPKPKTKYDEGFKTNVDILEKTAKFSLPFKVTAKKAGTYTVNISIRSQACNALVRAA